MPIIVMVPGRPARVREENTLSDLNRLHGSREYVLGLDTSVTREGYAATWRREITRRGANTRGRAMTATGDDEESMLVFADDRLVAVLVHLSDENEIAPGDWYLEAGFGTRLDSLNHPTFASLDAAQDWIQQRLASRLVRSR